MRMFEHGSEQPLRAFIALRVGVVMACWMFVMLSVLIDFWSGTSTAKAIGEPLLSKGFRKSVEKFGDYFKILLFALMFDALGTCFLHFYYVPIMTLLTTISIMFIEGKSVIENSRRKKAHAADVPDMVKRIVKAVTTKQGIAILEEMSQETITTEQIEKT